MARKNFLELGKDKDGFAIIPGKFIGGFPEGVSAKMLWDLWDIGSKFGQETAQGLGFKTHLLVMEFYDFRSNETGGKVGFVVAEAEETGLLNQGVFLFELKNGIQIMWDRRITPQEAVQAIETIDAYALSKGLIKDEIRKVFKKAGTASAEKMLVEKVFAEKDTVMLVVPGKMEETLKDFDHPELLAILEDGGIELLCLASEKEDIIADTEKKLLRLKEMGIGPKQIAEMSVKEIIALRELFASMCRKEEAKHN